MVLGRVDNAGGLEDTEVLVLPPTQQNGAVAVFGKDIVPDRTGRVGYALTRQPESLRRSADAAVYQSS